MQEFRGNWSFFFNVKVFKMEKRIYFLNQRRFVSHDLQFWVIILSFIRIYWRIATVMLSVELTQLEKNVNNIKDFIFKYEITQRYTRHLDEKIIRYLTSNRRIG